MKKTFGLITSILLVVTIITTSFRPVDTLRADTTLISAASKGNTLEARYDQFVSTVYKNANLEQSGLDMLVFRKALTGFYNLKQAHKLPANSSILTVVDFSRPSSSKRMWIIDLASNTLILNTWVAHGQGSGDNLPVHFSNNADSHQSSLGFYVTDDIYYGKHGRSLRIDGMDNGFNNKARERAIVIHAADYVCQNTINQLGRLGRSFGCPAVSPQVVDQVINTLKGKKAVFINGNDPRYTSRYLNTDLAANYVIGTNNGQLNAAL